ncbi:MAG: PilX N-terminal domain-containing pilus assembly protein [Desulfuromonadaceae bacterium]|nr:PilX N-terminal domain-containing pilus assembly protein [Desulfuromonadaceae bacterium]MDD2855152.1 PilX N-terminal domain-containing pilus assembly protein [Desulfuromonadaceae bacterium]
MTYTINSEHESVSALLYSKAITANERGAALIVVLVMLLLLTILGSTLLTTSTTDLKIAGNYRNNQKAFYINDYAFEFLKSDYGPTSVYYLLPQPDSPPVTITKELPPDPVTGEVNEVKYEVTNVGCLAGAPAGSGNDSDTSNAYNIYAVEITASGPNNATVSSLAGNLFQRGKPCD